jgi:GDP-L-fucose synthase
MQQVDFKDLVELGKWCENVHLNIGTGQDISIKDLANLIKKHPWFSREFVFREDRPDGT